MSLVRALWNDESGLVMSAEAVTIGTVGVLGTIVGLSAVGGAVNDELKEFAGAIRSLDQSYAYTGHRGCGAWTAGSCFIQQDVQQSLAELSADGPTDVKALQQQIEADRKTRLNPAPQPVPHVEPMPTPPAANQLPEKGTQKAEQPQPTPSPQPKD